MEVEIKESGESTCVLDVVFSKNEVESEFSTIAKELQPKVDVPGFRKGNAPVHIIKNRFKKHIVAESSTRLVYRGTSDALKQKKLKNISNPVLLEKYRPSEGKTHVGMFDLDGGFKFEISVDLPPKLDVKDYTGVEVSVETDNFDAWVKQKLIDKQREFGTEESVNRPAKFGDKVVASFEGKVDGSSLDGGKEEGFTLVIGDSVLPKDLEQSFINKIPGDKWSLDVKMPEDHPHDNLKGKVVEFECQLDSIHELIPHELNDELAKKANFDSLDDMMNSYKDNFNDEFEKPLRMKIFNAVMDKVLESNNFDAPPAWVDAEMKTNIRRLNLSGIENNEAAMRSMRELSERTVKSAYLMDQIYEKEESIRLTADELKQSLSDDAEKAEMQVEDFVAYLKQKGIYEGQISMYEQQKVMEFLIDSANVIMKERE